MSAAVTWRSRNGGTEWVATVAGVELCVWREADGRRWNAAIGGRVLVERGARMTWPSRSEAAAFAAIGARAEAKGA